MNQFHLRIQTNSPGELISWVNPIITKFKAKCPDSKVTIHLVPCQYKSGQEKEIAQKIPGVDHVTTPQETVKIALSLKKSPKETGAILLLGGDPFYTTLLSQKFQIPAYAYTEHSHTFSPRFKKVFRKQNDGDLMAVRPLEFSSSKQEILKKYNLIDTPYLLVLPGSRPQHFENLIPLLSEMLAVLLQNRPDITPLIQVSPFITPSLLEKIQKKYPIPSAQWIGGDSLELLSISKLLLTIPGTNNAEAMYMKCPMLIMVPLHHPKYLILDGLTGLISMIPLIGPALKRWGITHYLKTHPFLSLPNRYFQHHIAPEFIGKWSSAELAATVSQLWDSPDQLKQQIKHYSTINLAKEARCIEKMISTLLGVKSSHSK